MNEKLSESLKANLKTYFSIFIFPLFFWLGTNLSARQNDFHDLNFLKGIDNQSWICVGFIMLVSWSMLRVWKQMWIVKTQKDVTVSWKNDLWIMMHHKFICLLCVHHFSFFFSKHRFSFFFVSSWCNQIIIIIFFVFFKFFDSDGFFYGWTVCQTRVQTINVRWPLFKVRKIFALLSLKGVTKDHTLCFMIKKHGDTSFPKHNYFFFQEILTQEKKMVHVKVCPLLFSFFYSLFFFCLNHHFRFSV